MHCVTIKKTRRQAVSDREISINRRSEAEPLLAKAQLSILASPKTSNFTWLMGILSVLVILGSLMLISWGQLLKALVPRLVALGKSTSIRLVQLLNAPLPMLTALGSITPDRL